MANLLAPDEDAPNIAEHLRFAAWATVRHKERECESLRRTASAASAAWQSAEADLVHLREIIDSLDDAESVVRAPMSARVPDERPQADVLTAA